MTSRDSRVLRQGQIDDTGLNTFQTPRYAAGNQHHSPNRGSADRSPERSMIRRDMAARRPVRMARLDNEGDKRLQAKLEARRLQQSEGNDKEEDEGETGEGEESNDSSKKSDQTSVIDQQVPRVTVVTFPHYEVADETDPDLRIDNRLLLQEIEDTLGLSRSQSFRTSARTLPNSNSKRYGDTESETELLRRHVDARRSYNTKKKLAIAILPNKPTHIKGTSADNLDLLEGDTMAGPPSTNGLDLKTRPGIVGPILDIEPVDNKMTGLMGERRKTTLSNNNRFNNQRDSKEPLINPGISNSTQILLQSKMNTQFFSFPEISAEQQRKAGCTPRADERQVAPKTRRANSRSPPRGSRHRSKHNTAHECRRVDYQSDSELSEHASKNQVSRHSARSIEPANMCNESARKNTNRDRYSRMIALGLPKVNIDIDRHHFSRQSLKRRSLQLRERYDIGMDAEGNVKEDTTQQHMHPIPQATSITTSNAMSICTNGAVATEDDLAVESIDATGEDTSTVNWTANASGVGITILTSENETEIHRVIESNKPADSLLNGVSGAAADGGVRLDKRQPTRTTVSGVKEPVGVSYFKMGQPGKYESQFTLVDPPNSPRYRQVYQGNSGQQAHV